MSTNSTTSSSNRGGRPGLLALLLGALGCLFIWVVAPINNVYLASGFVSDDYMPVAVLFWLFLLVLLVNPALRRWAPGWALSRTQLGLVAGILLIASTLPGQGLLRMLPYTLARNVMQVHDSQSVAAVYEEMALPECLYPGEMAYGGEADASRWFVDRLPQGESIPWSAWIGPAFGWGALMVFLWCTMIGLGMIVFFHWRHTTRLEFPLLTAYGSIIDDPEKEGGFLGRLFHERAFWWAAGAVFVLHLLGGLNLYHPDKIPAIPLSWQMGSYFTEDPLRHLPFSVKAHRIYFLFIGMAFFMPKRISLSIWAFQLGYGVYQALARTYMPPFYGGAIHDHRRGALIAFVAAILWLDRRRWFHVGRLLLRSSCNAEEERDRRAAWLLVIGLTGTYGWLLWLGTQWHWALAIVVIGFCVFLAISRLIAETGTPFARLVGLEPKFFALLLPPALLTPVTVFAAATMDMFFCLGSRLAVAPMAVHAVGLDEDGPPRRHWRMALVALGVLAVGFVLCGAVHLHINYHNDRSLNGGILNDWGGKHAGWNNNVILRHDQEKNWPETTPHQRWTHLGVGAGLAGFLQWACLHFPKWPLHPVGLLLVFTHYGNNLWGSVFLGWLAKLLILRYGGAKLHRDARPFFIGLIVGDALASVFWFIVPMVLAALGREYQTYIILPT